MKSVARFSTDAELTSYINKAKSNGLSLIEVEGLVNAQGATISEVEKLRKLWNEQVSDTDSFENDSTLNIDSSFGKKDFPKVHLTLKIIK
jgi:hypothetical protein